MTAPTVGVVTAASGWYWYFGRATGLIALVLLTATIALGVLGPLRIFSARWPRFAIRTVHRDLALIAMVTIAIHVVTVVLDGYVHIPLSAAVIPFGSAYRPLWTALGAIAFDLLLAVVLTSLLRRQIGDRGWRAVHWLTYASWPVAAARGLGTGTDSGRWWSLAVTIACAMVVAGAALARLRAALPSPAPPREPARRPARSSAGGAA